MVATFIFQRLNLNEIEFTRTESIFKLARQQVHS